MADGRRVKTKRKELKDLTQRAQRRDFAEDAENKDFKIF